MFSMQYIGFIFTFGFILPVQVSFLVNITLQINHGQREILTRYFDNLCINHICIVNTDTYIINQKGRYYSCKKNTMISVRKSRKVSTYRPRFKQVPISKVGTYRYQKLETRERGVGQENENKWMIPLLILISPLIQNLEELKELRKKGKLINHQMGFGKHAVAVKNVEKLFPILDSFLICLAFLYHAC